MTLWMAHAGAVQASSVPSLDVAGGQIRITPYVLNDFDLGITQGASGTYPSGGLDARRIRYGARAKLPDDVSLGFIWDFGGEGYSGPRFEHSRLYQATVQYSGIDPLTITAGAFAPNLTLEGGQSSADKLFLSDPAIIAIVSSPSINGGQLGVQLRANRKRWLLEGALMGGRVGPGEDSRERALLLRAAGLVVHRPGLDVHLGYSAAWAFRTPQAAGSSPAIGFSDTAEYDVQPISYLDTGSIAANGIFSSGPEFGIERGRLWGQAEWYRIVLDRSQASTAWFGGWYGQVGWTVLGQPRRWRPGAGSWSAPSPAHALDPAEGRWGAVELGAEISEADLDGGGINGGRQRLWAAIANWWPAQPLRVSLQWQHADVSGPSGFHAFQAVLLRAQLFLH